MQQHPFFTVRNLCVSFGGILAVDNFCMSASKKSITGIIGPNGAGKTSVFNLITGIYKPTNGSIILDGIELCGKTSHDIAAYQVARTFQNIRLFPNMSVLDNLIAAAYLKRKKSFFKNLFFFYDKNYKEVQDQAKEILNFVGIFQYKKYIAQSLPYGLQRKLEIARALMTSPKILLLDEPAAGMNETEKRKLKTLIQSIAERDISILIIEHDMNFIMTLCEHLTVLNYGKIIATGSPTEVQKNELVIEAYLGKDFSF